MAERLLQHARDLGERTPAIFVWSVLLQNQHTEAETVASCDQLLLTPTSHDALQRTLAGIRLLGLLESLESERESARMALKPHIAEPSGPDGHGKNASPSPDR